MMVIRMVQLLVRAPIVLITASRTVRIIGMTMMLIMLFML